MHVQTIKEENGRGVPTFIRGDEDVYYKTVLTFKVAKRRRPNSEDWLLYSRDNNFMSYIYFASERSEQVFSIASKRYSECPSVHA